MCRIALLFCLLLLSPSSARSEAPPEARFTSLFDGKSLDGWIGDGKEFFAVEQGAMVCQQGCHGKLITEREYRDFVLRFDFKLTPGANNGLAIRTPVEGDAAYVGIELQILDNSADKYKDLKDYQFHGSAYGIAAAKRGALKPAGEWNTQEVLCQGRNLKITLNGKVILDINLDQVAPDNKTIDGNDHPGLRREKGHVGFLCHNDPVSFRNVSIKELAAE